MIRKHITSASARRRERTRDEECATRTDVRSAPGRKERERAFDCRQFTPLEARFFSFADVRRWHVSEDEVHLIQPFQSAEHHGGRIWSNPNRTADLPASSTLPRPQRRINRTLIREFPDRMPVF